VETKQATQLDVIASGGIQSSLEVIKSLALGAKAVGMAGYFLRLLEEEGQEFLMKQVDVIHEGLRAIMCALGCKHIEAFQYVPLVISGESYHWLTQRGFSPEVYARRQGNA
jgi:isopentenyl-diphosphate delta-isomerase